MTLPERGDATTTTFVKRMNWPDNQKCARCGETPAEHGWDYECRPEAVQRVIEEGRTYSGA